GISGSGRSGEFTGGTSWACRACTFENKPSVTSCEMCGSHIPAEERPPDESYRDSLLGDEELWIPDEWREDGWGGGGGGNSSSLLSDALRGGAIGAFGAGMLSSLEPRISRRAVVSSMVEGALLGGTAGAMFGQEVRRVARHSTSGVRAGATEPMAVPPPTAERSQGQGMSGQSQRQGGGWAYSASWPPVGMAVAHPAASEDFGLLRMVHQMQSMGLPSDAVAQIVAMSTAAGRNGAGGMAGTSTVGGLDYEGLLEQFGSPSGRPAPTRLISALPEETLTREAVDRLPIDRRQCCICLEDFAERDDVKRLPCLHMFHSLCISSWLQRSGTCPQCKHRVDGE
ncbi:unnamed protein product, partial [Discosporangium mesarthrocarpum]